MSSDPLATCEQASRHFRFDLDYRRAAKPREFWVEGITGDMIDDAFGDGRSLGEWSDGGREPTGKIDRGVFGGPEIAPLSGWRNKFMTAAIGEAVHEACEWFQHADGTPVLNPHGEHEAAIYELSAEFATKLCELVNQ